jgi:molecular chaperone GrpE
MTDEKKMATEANDPGIAGEQKPAADRGQPADDAGALEMQIGDLTDRLLRAHAEMDNLRKRNERDKADIAKFAISKFAREILAIGDNLQRAIAAVPPGAAEVDPALKSLIDGVAMTEREFVNVLERNGVQRIDSEGEPFDPHKHQAMTEVHDPGVAAGTVVQVFQPGYIIEGRVLRPAMVVVAKGGAKKAKVDAAAPGAEAANDDTPGGEGDANQNS